jgi:hypothetical protein
MVPLRPLAQHPSQGITEILEPTLDLLKLGQELDGVLPGEGLGPRGQHGRGPAEVFKLVVAV